MSASPALSEPADRASASATRTPSTTARSCTSWSRSAAASPAPSTARPQPSPPSPAAAPELSIAFERIARTIRRTIALARKLSDPAQPSPAERAAADAHQRRPTARKQIIRDLEDTIHREAHGRTAETEALHAELYERLDTMDLDDDLDTLPIAEIIAALRRDLGLDPHRTTRGISPWKRRRPQDVRALCTRAAKPSAVDRAGDRTRDPRPNPTPAPRTRNGTGPPGR